MRIAAKTDVGQVRLLNEDCYSVGELPGGFAWAVICDGMGGAAGGDVASRSAARLISEAVTASFQEHMSSRSIKNLLVTALDNANTRVFDLAQASDALMGMGTTVVAAIVSGRKACIAHAGDSRAYLLSGGEPMQLTKDHSVVQAMLDNGQITEDEARAHPRRNLITRALGVAETLEADYCEEELPPGSVLLLCTDGLTNCVDPAEFPALLAQNGFASFAEDLVRLANGRGGQDNITVVAIEI
ncbi:MAG: Stp1/IreP family PP2C-type Ser/Thr phosphatase [Oscillospiraceae bacterium]|nr:Stp1/IreP family PP2C-type Ser/Thr phosphatase [Oscillospiraceae bacterium]